MATTNGLITKPLVTLAGIALAHLTCAGCFSGEGAEDDEGPGERSSGGSAGGPSTGGSAGTLNDAECTIAHCDCSYCDFNLDYRCVDNCVASCGDKEVGFRCNGSSICTSVANDPAHCGSCNNPCPAGTFCSQGVCTSGGTMGTGSGGAGGSGGTPSGGSSGSGSSGGGAPAGGPGAGGTGNAGAASGGSSAAGGAAGGGTAVTATDPCAGVTGVYPGGALGYFCGENLPLSICTPGAAPGTLTCSTPPADRLFLCSEGVTVGYVTCADGCYAAPAGEPDYCLDADPCAGSPRNGTFCGANLSPLAEPDVLYTCNGQATLATEACGGGCNAAPLGQADRCAPVEQG
jgi:hypothetical protein